MCTYIHICYYLTVCHVILSNVIIPSLRPLPRCLVVFTISFTILQTIYNWVWFDSRGGYLSLFLARTSRETLHPVSVRRFPSFRTQPLENFMPLPMQKTISEQPSPWRKSSERESCYGDRVYDHCARCRAGP